MIYQHSVTKLSPLQAASAARGSVQVIARSPSVLPSHTGAISGGVSAASSYIPPSLIEWPTAQAAGGPVRSGGACTGMAQSNSQTGIPCVSTPANVHSGPSSPPVQVRGSRAGQNAQTTPKEPVVLRVVPTPMRTGAAPIWSAECSCRLAAEGEESCFIGRARLLDRHSVTSVRDAVDSLNRRLVWCPEDCCIVFSAAERVYYLLYRSGRREAACALFGLRKQERVEEPAGSGGLKASPPRTASAGGHSPHNEGGSRSSVTPGEVSRQSSLAGIPHVAAFAETERHPAARKPPIARAGQAHSYIPTPSPPLNGVAGAPCPRVRVLGHPLPGYPAQSHSYQPPGVAHNSESNDGPAQRHALSPQLPAKVPYTPATNQRLSTPREALERDLTEPEKVKYADLDFIESLGSGEFGQVFRGTYQGEEVAIKQLYWDGTVTELVMQDLAKEIESFRHLRHKRLVRFIGACLEMPHLCLVTEYMPGGSLHHLLHVRKLQLPRLHSTNMCLQVADGVMYLHSQNPTVVHRDLKSLNIVLDLSLNIKICDFGLTEPMERTHITKKNNGGSPRYMAPELFDSKTKITEKIDVWAMGCIFVEIQGGPLPYETISTLADLTREMLVHRRAPHVPGSIPHELRQVVSSCLNFDYRLRPSSKATFEQLKAAKKQLRDAGLL